MALNTQIEQMNTQTPAHANEFNKRFNQLGDNDKYLNENIKTLQENKVDKINGKGLSTEDFTTESRKKLGGIDYNANNYTHPNTHPASMITCNNGSTVESSLNQMNTEISNIEVTAEKTKLSNSNFKSKNVDGALTELFQYGSDTKSMIASIVTAQGVTTPSDATWKTVATNIKNISVGVKYIRGTAIINATMDRYCSFSGTTSWMFRQVRILGLGFLPKTVILNFKDNTAKNKIVVYSKNDNSVAISTYNPQTFGTFGCTLLKHNLIGIDENIFLLPVVYYDEKWEGDIFYQAWG